MDQERHLTDGIVARLTAIIEAAPTAIVMIDGGGRIVLINRAAETLFGYERDELLGSSVERLVPARFRDHHPTFREDYLAAPTPRPMGAGRDLHGLRKDGSEFPIEIGLNPVSTDGGTFVISAIVDISERKRHEEALRHSRERFRLIVDSSPDAVVTMGDDGKVTNWNPRAEALFGWRHDEAVGRDLAELIVPDAYRAAHRQGLRKFLATGEGPLLGKPVELTAQHKDGHYMTVELTVSPLRLGERYEFSAFIRDIAERKRMETRFLATVESAPVAMVMIDSGGRIVLVNKETEQLFGYRRKEMIGKQVEMLVPVEFRGRHPRLRAGFMAAPAARRMGAGRDLFGVRKDGSLFPVEIGLSPIQTDEGRFVLSTIVDITERKRLESKLQQAHEQLSRRV